MGVVYKATDTLLDKVVALKVLTERVCDQAAVRFQAEAKAAGKLNHPSIVMILDFGVTEDGEPYMVQEFVEGTTLAELLKPSGLEIEHALALFDQICSGLAKAHESGIIHRDIKPSNVIVSATNDQPLAKLTDFGIAKMLEADQGLTSTGTMIGSPLYMSPEQTRGEQIDARSDIYSLGCLIFETLAGQPPLQGETSIETAQMCLSVKPQPLSAVATEKIPNELDALVAKCLEKEPDKRYQSIAEVAHALEQISDPELEAPLNSNVFEGNRFGKALTAIVATVMVLGALYACMVMQAPSTAPTQKSVSRNAAIADGLTAVDMLAEATKGEDIDVPENKVSARNEREVTVMNATPAYLNEIVKAYPELNVLEIKWGQKFDGRNLKVLANLPRLNFIKLVEVPLKDNILDELALLKNLTRIKFDRINTLDGSGLKVLQKMNLTQINVTNSIVNDLIISNIAKTRAKVVTLEGCNGVTADRLKLLRDLRTLNQLTLESTDLSDSTLLPLKGMPLTFISVGDNPKLTIKSFEVLRTMGAREIALQGCTSIPDDDRIRLGNQLNLRYEKISEHLFAR